MRHLQQAENAKRNRYARDSGPDHSGVCRTPPRPLKPLNKAGKEGIGVCACLGWGEQLRVGHYRRVPNSTVSI